MQEGPSRQLFNQLHFLLHKLIHHLSNLFSVLSRQALELRLNLRIDDKSASVTQRPFGKIFLAQLSKSRIRVSWLDARLL
jgi:hypothetical protein